MSAQHTEFVDVTKEQFYAAFGPRNVHPRPYRERTEWVDLNTHAVVGISTPGYANTYGADGRLTPETYKARATGASQ